MFLKICCELKVSFILLLCFCCNKFFFSFYSESSTQYLTLFCIFWLPSHRKTHNTLFQSTVSNDFTESIKTSSIYSVLQLLPSFHYQSVRNICFCCSLILLNPNWSAPNFLPVLFSICFFHIHTYTHIHNYFQKHFTQPKVTTTDTPL